MATGIADAGIIMDGTAGADIIGAIATAIGTE